MTENKKTKYPSKVDGWIIALIAIGFAIAIAVALNETNWPWVAAVFVPLTVLIFSLMFTIHYTIYGSQLIVRDNLFKKKAYNIMDITSIEPTHNPLSAPAASLDRIAIRFRNVDELLLSPKDKDRFYQHLKKINPNITFGKPRFPW